MEMLKRGVSSNNIAKNSQWGIAWVSRRTTYFVRLPDRPQSGAASASCNGLAPHLVGVHLRDIVEFVLEGLPSSIFASTRNFTNTGSVIQNPLQLLSRELREWSRCASALFILAICALVHTGLQFSWKVAVNSGQWLRVNT